MSWISQETIDETQAVCEENSRRYEEERAGEGFDVVWEGIVRGSTLFLGKIDPIQVMMMAQLMLTDEDVMAAAKKVYVQKMLEK